MTPQLTILALSAALLGAAACTGTRELDPAAPPGLPDSIFVEAFNDNFYDARVHAVFGGKRLTLGTIPGNGGHTETALAWEPRELVFEVSFVISGKAYVSLPVDVARGGHVEVRLPQNIDASGFFRRVARN